MPDESALVNGEEVGIFIEKIDEAQEVVSLDTTNAISRADRLDFINLHLNKNGYQSTGEFLHYIFENGLYNMKLEDISSIARLPETVVMYIFADTDFASEYARLLVAKQFNPEEREKTLDNMVAISQKRDDPKEMRMAIEAARLLFQQTRTLEPDRVYEETSTSMTIRIKRDDSVAITAEKKRIMSQTKSWVRPDQRSKSTLVEEDDYY